MVNDNHRQSGQVADSMFSSNSGTTKTKMPYGTEENEFDMSTYYGQGPSGGVAERLGQNQFSSAFYNQPNNRGLGTQQGFGRSISIPGLIPGHVTPTSSDNSNQVNQNRGILPLNRGGLGSSQITSNQVSGNVLGGTRPGLPSPTRGLSPKDMFNLKPTGNRNLNAAISRNHSFPSQQSQSLSMNAIGSESLSQLRHQQNISSSSPATSNMGGITALGSFNLDQSDFPALAQHERTRPIGSQPSTSTKPPYVGMVSKQTESSEFQIHNEDFPALPGSAAMNVMKAGFPEQDGRGDESTSKFNPLGSLHIGGQVDKPSQKPSTSNQQKGIQVLADNTIKNIPNSMLTDQYGIIGLFAFIKAAETDPTLVQLALGNDLTTLGLNLNSPDNLYHKFQSPFSRQPCRLQDIDYFVPSEYLTNAHIRDKLAPIKLNRYGEDLLFFVYYSNPGDVLQLAAAAELYNRDWRFHKEDRVWITRMPQVEPRMKTSAYEQGTYYYFDCQNWRKAAKDFHLEYDKLEERPHLPNLVSLHFNPAQHG